MTVYTARGTTEDQPLSSFQFLAPWSPIPSDAKNITVLVHGFNVSESEATTKTFPTWFKRLYWSGHQVLDAQNHAYVVGVSWPGDRGTLPPAYYVPNEFNAFRTGVPFARLINQISNGGTRQISVFAHSMGNLVVNSALLRAESGEVNADDVIPNGTIRNYVMNEAAVAAEAFSATYAASQDEANAFLQHAQDYGYPDDQLWQNQWANMNAGQPCVLDGPTGACNPDYTNLTNWNTTLNASNYVTRPLPNYTLRWGQARPSTGLPDTDTSSTPRRGPWLGLFQRNPSRTRMVNTFNTGDNALNAAWATAQVRQKPYAGVLGLAGDNASTQYWASLTGTDGSQEYLWGGNCSGQPVSCQHANVIRQWAELTYWYPALSGAAGSRLLYVNGVTNIDLSLYGPPADGIVTTAINTLLQGMPETQSHSYLVMRPFASVYGAYQQIRQSLEQ